MPEKENERPSHYMYSKKIKFNHYMAESSYEDAGEVEYSEWNDRHAEFGDWELWGFIEEDFCNAAKPRYNLYSDWLYSRGRYGNSPEKYVLSEITMQYKLAYLTDAYYFGVFDEDEHHYYYDFLGAYAKPVIYLYPEKETDVTVKPELDGGGITCSYPDYGNGWNVKAYPDGTIIDNADGNEYYCLYWEGVGKADWDMSEGFVVKRGDTAAFLRGKLKEIGLTPRESNEFIIYWRRL